MSTTQSPVCATGASVIVYGPQGSGKSTHAKALAAFFGLAKIEDDESCSIYRRLRTPHEQAQFKARGVLVLTHFAPPEDLADSRRILHIRDALRLAGIRTHATSKRAAA